MKKKIFSFIVAVLVLSTSLVTPSNVSASKDNWPHANLSLVASSAILIDANTGAILYTKKADKKRYPASITKIMTALLTIEKGNLNDNLTYSKNALACIKDGAANIGAVVGEQMSVKDTLYGMMLQSGNECATALGEYVGGNEKDFAVMMTNRAKQAGATGTNFKNANGLHNKDHYVTAHDMAFIMKDALKYPTFRDVINTTAYTIPKNNKRKKRFFAYQRHKMVYENTALYYDGIIGGKTGFTDQARNTLVTAASRNGLTLISVVLHSDTAHVYSDTKKLLDFGFKNYKSVKVSSFSTSLQSDDSILISPFWDVDEDKDKGRLTIDPNATITLPKKASISDVTKNFTYSASKDSFANISYKYGSHFIGTANITYEKKTKSNTAKVVEATTSAKEKPTNVDSKSVKKAKSKSKTSAVAKTFKKIFTSVAFYIVLAVLIVLIVIGRLLYKRKKKIDQIREAKRNRYTSSLK